MLDTYECNLLMSVIYYAMPDPLFDYTSGRMKMYTDKIA